MPFIVFIPRIMPNTFLYATNTNQSFRLRHYPDPNHNPVVVLQQAPGYGWDELIAEANQEGSLCVERPGDIPYNDTEYWYDFIQKANQLYLSPDGITMNENNDIKKPSTPISPGPQPIRSSAEGRLIPKTVMRHLYNLLEVFASKHCRLALAEEVLRVPSRLARQFRASVEHFSRYDNISETFVPTNGNRNPLPDCGQLTRITSTNELSAFLVQQQEGMGNIANEPDLNFQFIERELIPARTTGHAVYEDGTSAQRGVQLDWLLINRQDDAPIVTEIKVGDDADPFYALVQSLMYVSELVTSSQWERLKQHYHQFHSLDESPSVDIYLVVSDFNDRSKIQCDIKNATSQICECLIGEPDVYKFVRRIACVDAYLDQTGQLAFESLFRFDRPDNLRPQKEPSIE